MGSVLLRGLTVRVQFTVIDLYHRGVVLLEHADAVDGVAIVLKFSFCVGYKLRGFPSLVGKSTALPWHQRSRKIILRELTIHYRIVIGFMRFWRFFMFIEVLYR